MPRVAAIDCGTNSIRLLVADVTKRDDGTSWLRDVHREQRVVRLGQGVDATGVLAPEALERTRVALADYAAILLRKGAESVRMVATSATRDARNRDDFFGMTSAILGAPAEVISGDEEAALSFTGAVGDLDPDDGPFLVVDVGGGSTELVLGTWDGVRAIPKAARSTDIGCVRITERCLRDDPPTADQVMAATELAEQVLAQAFDVVPVAEAKTWVGVAGTATTIGAIALDLPAYDSDAIHLSRVAKDRIHEISQRLLGLNHDQRAAIPVIHPGRVDVIGGGSLIFEVLAKHLPNITELTVSEHDILDGIALSQL
jgi:exopolyphosphatase/guanosine-5'-triphosphate,3'-diphosphate pyrophosphatase